jgi:hypothetical protein
MATLISSWPDRPEYIKQAIKTLVHGQSKERG